MGEGTAVIFRPRLWFLGGMVSYFLMAAAAPAQDAIPSPSPDPNQIKQDLLQNKKGLADIQKKLSEEKKQQRRDMAKEKNILSRLQKVDQKLNQLGREKDVNDQDLQETRSRINELQDEITANKSQLTQSRLLLKQRLKALYRVSFRRPFLGGLLDSESFTDLARKLKFELMLAKSNEKILSQTLDHEQQLEQDSKQWESEEKRRQRIVTALGRQEKSFSREQKNRTSLLTSIRHEQDVREQTIEDLSDAAQELQTKVAFFLQQAVEAKKKAAYVPVGTGLMVKRGKYSWPVTGHIISFFGRHKNLEFNAIVDNTGIQIQAPAGTPFRAVDGGRVRFADWFKGYGKLVILDHGEGYYSLYAQASELNVSEGQEVASGQILGTVGDTGSLVGSSLYFEIRKNGVPQDPLRWLKYRM